MGPNEQMTCGAQNLGPLTGWVRHDREMFFSVQVVGDCALDVARRPPCRCGVEMGASLLSVIARASRSGATRWPRRRRSRAPHRLGGVDWRGRARDGLRSQRVIGSPGHRTLPQSRPSTTLSKHCLSATPPNESANRRSHDRVCDRARVGTRHLGGQQREGLRGRPRDSVVANTRPARCGG
jgi:hypothetical protein